MYIALPFGEWLAFYQILASNVITCLEPLQNCQCHNFQVLKGLDLTVTEINMKKVQKQDLKNIRNVKGCRDGMPKSIQTR